MVKIMKKSNSKYLTNLFLGYSWFFIQGLTEFIIIVAALIITSKVTIIKDTSLLHAVLVAFSFIIGAVLLRFIINPSDQKDFSKFAKSFYNKP